MKKLNFALVGCGRIARQKHAPILSRELEDAGLVAVCDIKPERSRELGERYNIPWYTDYHQMMKDHEGIDVISILTESGNHARHAVDLARHGRHIVVEKPISLTIEGADEMIRVCEKNRCRLFVVMQNRYNRCIQKLKEAIDEGRFGRIFFASARVRWCRRQSYYDMDNWRGTWEFDGGVFAQQAFHYLDLLGWLAGDVGKVFAKSMNAFAGIQAEDTGTALLEFENGALGAIEATTATRPRDMEGSLSIMGSRGIAEVGGFALNEMRVWQFEDKRPEDDEAIERYRTAPQSVYGFGHHQYLKEVTDAIARGKKGAVEGNEGKKALRLLHGVYSSIETGREVLLSDNPESSRLGRG